ncbi:MAG: aminotransferase class I/II-fold pyridoxal phosphate-dependent enzyme, partial [Thermoguttaceae bacterium]|nr:aminotransferase class I/II-fold pyridoxal phosphate-dependent enzyme [Thermoguttaceae bacterium]
VEPDLFVACPAKITFPNPDNPQIFKYVVDFDAVERAVAENDVAAILVSRPTNPSGNVLRRNELERLDALAERIGAWLIVDSAYGGPFPGIVEDERELDSVFWGRRTILTFSLSKIGLPGLRTGFVVAPEEIVERLAAITAIVGLANGALGQRIAKPFFDETGEILRASREIVRPFYQRRRAAAVELLGDELRRVGVDGRLHASEGAFFLWLWAPELKSGSKTLYRNLKERGVLAIPGDEFFYGLDGAATDGGDGGVKVGATGKVGQSDGGKAERDPIFEAHRRQMLRISFSAAENVVERGFRIIAETLAETVAADARNAR